MRVQAFVAQLSFEAVGEGIVGRFARPREVRRDLVEIGLVIEHAGDELRATVETRIVFGLHAVLEQHRSSTRLSFCYRLENRANRK
jgi:hypothetical protein